MGSLKFRLLLGITSAVMALIGLTIGLGYYFIRSQARWEFVLRAESVASGLSDLVSSELTHNHELGALKQLKRVYEKENLAYVKIRKDGKIWAKLPSTDPEGEIFFQTFDEIQHNKGTMELEIGISYKELDHRIHHLLWQQISAAGPAYLLFLFVLLWVVTRLFIRIEYFVAVFQEIGQGNFDVSLPSRSHSTNPHELDLMQIAIERMLRELKTLLSQRDMDQSSLANASKLSSLGEMAGGIAHEINNPLMVITGKAGTLRRRLEQNRLEKEFGIQELTKIEATVARIGKIIQGLRSFARNSEQDPPAAIDLCAVVNETLELCRERFKASAVDLQVDLQQSIVVLGRAAQLSQVLMNLLNNGFDAIQLLPEKWIRLKAEDLEDRVRITVTDSGKGIPVNIIDKIMQPFFTTKEVGKGTGLGLSISKGIIESHKGTFAYQLAGGHTQFVITLPKAPAITQKNAA